MSGFLTKRGDRLPSPHFQNFETPFCWMPPLFCTPPPNTHTKKFSSPFPSCPPVYLVTDGVLHIEQIIPKVLPEVSIVRTTIMTYLKKLVGIKGQLKVEINFISVFTPNYVHPCTTPLV